MHELIFSHFNATRPFFFFFFGNTPIIKDPWFGGLGFFYIIGLNSTLVPN